MSFVSKCLRNPTTPFTRHQNFHYFSFGKLIGALSSFSLKRNSSLAREFHASCAACKVAISGSGSYSSPIHSLSLCRIWALLYLLKPSSTCCHPPRLYLIAPRVPTSHTAHKALENIRNTSSTSNFPSSNLAPGACFSIPRGSFSFIVSFSIISARYFTLLFP